MNSVTTDVHFALVDTGLEVTTPPGLRPLADFLETEIGTSEVMLGEIGHHIRHSRDWQFTGDACDLLLTRTTVTVENQYTGARVSLSREDFHTLLAELHALLSCNPSRDK